MDRFQFSCMGRTYKPCLGYVVPEHLYALPASAMISKIMTQDTAYSVTAAGIPVCTLTLQ